MFILGLAILLIVLIPLMLLGAMLVAAVYYTLTLLFWRPASPADHVHPDSVTSGAASAAAPSQFATR